MRILIAALEAIWFTLRATLAGVKVTGKVAEAIAKFERKLRAIYKTMRNVRGAPTSGVPTFQKARESLVDYLGRVFSWVTDNKLYTMSIVYAFYDLYDDLTAEHASEDVVETKIEAVATMIAYKASEVASFDVGQAIDAAEAQMQTWIADRGLKPRNELRDDLKKAIYEKSKEMVESRKAAPNAENIQLPNTVLSNKVTSQGKVSNVPLSKVLANEHGLSSLSVVNEGRSQAGLSISRNPKVDLAYQLEKTANVGEYDAESQLRLVSTQIKQAKTLLGISERDFIRLMSILFELDMNALKAYVRIKDAIE